MGYKIKIEIDMEPIIKQINEYIKRKAIKEVGVILENELTSNVTYPNIIIKDKELNEKIDKLLDWKNDIEKGWIKLSDYEKNN